LPLVITSGRQSEQSRDEGGRAASPDRSRAGRDGSAGGVVTPAGQHDQAARRTRAADARLREIRERPRSALITASGFSSRCLRLRSG
jgi:O-methyltransferase involved in polyketide biosynthesis